MSDIKETSVDYIVGEKTATVFTAEQKWINKITNLSNEYPNDVKIVKTNADGSILAHLPPKWCFKFSAPRKVSDEQREAARIRLAEYRKNI